MYVILVYDICYEEKGQRVLSKVFKVCKKYMHHIQNSVFEGELSDLQYEKLKSELKQYLRKDIDSVIMFKSRQEKWLDKEMLGIQTDNTSMFL